MTKVREEIKEVKDILNYFKDWDLDQESKDYFRYHSLRYNYLLKEVDEILKKIKNKKDLKILDIGPAYQTELLRNNLPNIPINSLGYYDPRFKKRKIDKHTEFDLNDAQFKEKWPKIQSHDIVILAETIEHLYTSPKLVLQFMSTLIKPGGYLIIQTPNAVSLDRRIKMLLGKHPYDMIRENYLVAGHFREYTIQELISISKEAKFKIEKITMYNYFVHKRFRGKVYDFVCKILPSNFRHGLTLVLRK